MERPRIMTRVMSSSLMLIILLLFGGGLSNCADSPPASLTPPLILRPTWTPTPPPRVRPRIMPGPAPARPSSRPTPVAPTATPSPAAPRTPQPLAQRIDAAGPKPVATVAPLPPGAGRSPVRIRIPAINLDAPVKPMHWQMQQGQSVWQVPHNAAGHHINSAFPGETGNIILSGHHNIHGSIFARLSTIGEPQNPLRLGHPILLQDELGRTFTYRITAWQRIPEKKADIALRQENASYLLPTTFPQLTLITCWPATNNTHRVIIQARLTHIQAP